MKNLTSILILAAAILFGSGSTFAQQTELLNTEPVNKFKLKQNREPQTSWGLNLTFSDNGFGIGATKYLPVSKDIAFTAGIIFSTAKDEREFDQYDYYGNSITPFKENRLFMFPIINLGMQYRLFRDDVSDNLRPFLNFGVTPTAIVYTPYSESFLSSFKYAKAKYTVGGYAGVGMDYLMDNRSALSFNIRYYYIGLFGEGIRSISTTEKKQFGGLYFLFSYNFLK